MTQASDDDLSPGAAKTREDDNPHETFWELAGFLPSFLNIIFLLLLHMREILPPNSPPAPPQIRHMLFVRVCV